MPCFGVPRPLRHRWIDMGLHAVTHAVFSQLRTSYNSLSGFETWSVGCLVTTAVFFCFFFLEEQSYSSPRLCPPPPTTTPSFYSAPQWTPFYSLQSQGFKRQEDASEGGWVGERTHTHTLSHCSYRAPTTALLKINRGKGSGIASQFFCTQEKHVVSAENSSSQHTGQRWNCQKKLWKESLNYLQTLTVNIVGNKHACYSPGPPWRRQCLEAIKIYLKSICGLKTGRNVHREQRQTTMANN